MDQGGHGGAFGGAKAGGAPDPLVFVKRPLVSLRICTLLFAVVVFGCVSSSGWFFFQAKGKEVCVMNEDASACHFSTFVGIIAFIASIGFLVGEWFFEQMSSIKTRKHFVIFDMAFSGFWGFMFFVVFCYMCYSWSKSDEMFSFASSNIIGAIFFTFLSIFSWIGCAGLAFQRYKSGSSAAFTEGLGEYDANYPEGTYQSYPGGPDDGGVQEPPFGQQDCVDLIIQQLDAENAIKAGDFKTALSSLDRAPSRTSNESSKLKLLRAECYAHLGRTEEAKTIASEIMNRNSENFDAIFVLTVSFYYEDNPYQTFNGFRKLLTSDPANEKWKEFYSKFRVLYQKKDEGNAAYNKGELAKAYNLYTEALAVDPENRLVNSKLFFNRASVAFKLTKFSQTLKDSSAAIELDKTYTKALFLRAKTFTQLRMLEEAVADLERLITSNPDCQEYQQLLAETALELTKNNTGPKDYYKILGVERGASNAEIRQAYYDRARDHHPDRHADASEWAKNKHETKFKEIQQAYRYLSGDD